MNRFKVAVWLRLLSDEPCITSDLDVQDLFIALIHKLSIDPRMEELTRDKESDRLRKIQRNSAE